eukprot:7549853-Alexandrium_andersonii.AAC.1
MAHATALPTERVSPTNQPAMKHANLPICPVPQCGRRKRATLFCDVLRLPSHFMMSVGGGGWLWALGG